MTDDDNLRKLIDELIETIEINVQDSPEILDVLHRIEEEGYTLDLSLLVGIFIRDGEGVDMYFSSLPDDGDAFEAYKQLLDKSKTKVPGDLPNHWRWTEGDRDFLDSIGVELNSSHPGND